MILGGLDRTQAEIAVQLHDLTMSGGFPNAVLFSGEAYSGRMFAARQIVSALGIPSDNVIIVSDRNHSYRIRTALDLFRRHRNNSSMQFLKENVSIMLQQYHGALIEGQSTTAGKRRFGDAADAMDLLTDLENSDEGSAEKIADRLGKALSPLIDGNRTSSISIGQVRAIRDWCSTSSMDGVRKFIVIEGLENASDGAVNALLKTLEEPPEGSRFILISANAGRIPATILSRARRFRFRSLGEEDKRYILGRLFVDPSRYHSLEAFFLEGGGLDDSLLSRCASALLMKQLFDMPSLVSELERSQGWDRFFTLVLEEIRKAFIDGRLDQRRAEYLLEQVNSAVAKGRAFNQTRRLTLDFVVYRVQEVAR